MLFQKAILQNITPFRSYLLKSVPVYDISLNNNILIKKRFMEINFRPTPFMEFTEMADIAGFKVDKVYGSYDYSNFDENKSPFMLFL